MQHMKKREENNIITATPLPTTEKEENNNNNNNNNSSSSSRAYFNFINSIQSPYSRKTYDFILTKYMQHYNLQAVDDLILLAPNVVEDQIITWLVSLRESVSYVTRCTYMAAILTFYEINDITLRRKRIARFLGQETTRRNKDRAYTTEEIRKMLEHADLRSKTLVLLLASSGMRLGAVPDLRLRHLKKISEPYNLYRITVYENTKKEYYTYCTPECAAAIDTYIAYRQEKGEIITPEAPLIRENFDRLLKGNDDGSGGSRNELLNTTKKKPIALATRGIGAIISSLLIRAGIIEVRPRTELQILGKQSTGSERKAVHRAHGLRKYLLTALTEAEVDPQYRKMLLGQHIGLDESYLKPTEQQLLQKYVKVIDSITINNEHRLRIKVEELAEKQSDIEIMKLEQKQKDKQFARLEQKIKLQEEATALTNTLLQNIATHMNLSADIKNTIPAAAVKQQLNEAIPVDQYEDMELRHVRRGLELDDESDRLVKDTIIPHLVPECTNVSKKAASDNKQDMKSVLNSINKILKINKDSKNNYGINKQWNMQHLIKTNIQNRCLQHSLKQRSSSNIIIKST
jgi:integrase